MTFVAWVAQRLLEPSTYAGIAALFAAFHIGASPDLLNAVTALGMAVGGFLAVVLSERKH